MGMHESRYQQVKPYLSVAFFLPLLLAYGHGNDSIRRYGSVLMAMYMWMDMHYQPRMTTIYRIHHGLSLWLCGYDMVYGITTCGDERVRQAMYDTEWSTIVFSVAQILRRHDERVVAGMVFGLFFGCFVYWRTFLIPYVYDVHVSTWVACRDVPAWGLYVLNTHWLFEMLTKHWKVSPPSLEVMMMTYHWLITIRHVHNPLAVLMMIVLGTFGWWEMMVALFVCMAMMWNEAWFRGVPQLLVSVYWTFFHRKKKENHPR